jgi:hypothetical protein
MLRRHFAPRVGVIAGLLVGCVVLEASSAANPSIHASVHPSIHASIQASKMRPAARSNTAKGTGGLLAVDLTFDSIGRS